MSETDHEIRSKTPQVLIAGGVAGAVAGAYAGNYIFPPTVDIISDGVVQTEVSLSLTNPGLHATYGPTLDAPNLPIADVPTVGNIGLDAEIKEFNIDITDPNSSDQLSALFAKPDSALVDPIKHALYERIATGAVSGALAGMAMSYMALQTYRMKKQDGTIDYVKNRLSRFNNLTNRVVAGGLAMIALTGCGVAIGASSSDDGSDRFKHPLPPEITKNIPSLQGATVSGLGGEALTYLARAGTAYKQNVDESLSKSRDNFGQAFKKYSSENNIFTGGKYKVAMHISDAHCNYAMYNFALGPVVKAFQPEIILNTGDTFTNGGTMFYEKDCMNSMTDVIGDNTDNVTMINTIGNHDPKRVIKKDEDPKVITPTKDTHYTVSTNIGDIVATPDLSLTTWSTIPEEHDEKMDKLTAEQGAKTNKFSCEQYERTGKKPIAMVHRPYASARVTLEGCASLVLKGHTHERQKIKNVPAKDGSEVLHHVAGSSSGTHNTIAIYETPKQPATYTMLYFDNDNKLKGSTTVTFDTGGRVTIKDEDVPTKKSDNEDYNQFLTTFDPEYK